MQAKLFSADRPIWTKVRDEMPTRYFATAQVKNSLLGDGCVIEGTVENSVLFRGVRVGKGAVVKDAVVIGIGTFLTTVIDFILVAFVVFLVVKAFNTAKKKLEKPAEPETPPEEPEPTKEELLLTEIRDLLKKQ